MMGLLLSKSERDALVSVTSFIDGYPAHLLLMKSNSPGQSLFTTAQISKKTFVRVTKRARIGSWRDRIA